MGWGSEKMKVTSEKQRLHLEKLMAGNVFTKNKMAKISIAIVTNRQVQPKTLQSLLELAHNNKHHELDFVVATEGYTTAQGRIYCVIQAQKNQSNFILYVDDDMTFEPDILDRLLEHNKEIVGVNSYSRTFPLSSTVMMMDENGEYKDPSKNTEWAMEVPEKLFEVLAIGMGVALIKMEVFENINKPWFKFDIHRDGYMIQGEDAWFCSQARKEGYKIWADGSLEIGHIGNYIYKKPERKLSTFIENK
ncbi:MAG: hypothetical protein AAB706_01550 [Patescibacteria group bacterium]